MEILGLRARRCRIGCVCYSIGESTCGLNCPEHLTLTTWRAAHMVMQFKLEIHDVLEAKTKLQYWGLEQNIRVPLVIEVSDRGWANVALLVVDGHRALMQVYVLPNNGVNDDIETSGSLLERWCMQYIPNNEAALLTGGISRSQITRYSPRAVYKRLSLLLRSLFTYTRLLPGQKLNKAAMSQKNNSFSLAYKIHSCPTGKKSEKMKLYSFAPVDTVDGELKLWVDHAPQNISKYVSCGSSKTALAKRPGTQEEVISPGVHSPCLSSGRKPWRSRLAGLRAFSGTYSSGYSTSAPSQFSQNSTIKDLCEQVDNTGGHSGSDFVECPTDISGRQLSSPMEIPGANERKEFVNLQNFLRPETVSRKDVSTAALQRGSSLPNDSKVDYSASSKPESSFSTRSSGQTPRDLASCDSHTSSHGHSFPGVDSLHSSQGYPIISGSPDLPFAFTPSPGHLESISRSARPMIDNSPSSSVTGREISTSVALLRRDSSTPRSYHFPEGFQSIGYSISPLHDNGMSMEYSISSTPHTFSSRGGGAFARAASGIEHSRRQPQMLLEHRSPGTDRTATSSDVTMSKESYKEDLPFAFADDPADDVEVSTRYPSDDGTPLSLGIRLGLFTKLMRESATNDIKYVEVDEVKSVIHRVKGRILEIQERGPHVQ